MWKCAQCGQVKEAYSIRVIGALGSPSTWSVGWTASNAVLSGVAATASAEARRQAAGYRNRRQPRSRPPPRLRRRRSRYSAYRLPLHYILGIAPVGSQTISAPPGAKSRQWRQAPPGIAVVLSLMNKVGVCRTPSVWPDWTSAKTLSRSLVVGEAGLGLAAVSPSFASTFTISARGRPRSAIRPGCGTADRRARRTCRGRRTRRAGSPAWPPGPMGNGDGSAGACRCRSTRVRRVGITAT